MKGRESPAETKASACETEKIRDKPKDKNNFSYKNWGVSFTRT